MNEQAIIESTYWHSCYVYRDIEVEDEVGRTTFQKDATIYSNVPCALSKTSDTFNTVQQVPNEIKYTMKLFMSPAYQIHTGDKVKVLFENGVERILKAGESFLYPTHQEIPMLREDEA